jgi:3',5'-cyclic-AMP phosphodiesterase
MAAPLRIGHISDLHLRQHLSGTSAVAARRSRDMPGLLVEALRALRGAEVDVVVITGDLIDHPHEPQDTVQNLRDGELDLLLVAEALAQLPCPWAVLPGNHDHPELFQRVFGSQPREIEVQGTRIISFFDWDRPLPTALEADNVPVNVPRRVGAERRCFADVLADTDPRPQVHLQHYVITPRRDEGWPHTYVDGEMLRDSLAADHRVRLCLSGHYHPGVDPFHYGESGVGSWFHVAPAFCQAPHPYLVHELAHDGSLETIRSELRPSLETAQ